MLISQRSVEKKSLGRVPFCASASILPFLFAFSRCNNLGRSFKSARRLNKNQLNASLRDRHAAANRSETATIPNRNRLSCYNCLSEFETAGGR